MQKRRRFQRGHIGTAGSGKNKHWIGQYRDSFGRRTVKLGLCSEMTRAQAHTALAAKLAPINAAMTDGRTTYTFKQYVEQVFLPHARKGWKDDSTAPWAEGLIQNHLVAHFDQRKIEAITRMEMQEFLDYKATTHSASVVKHLKWELMDIFDLAVADAIVPVNRAAELRVREEDCQPGRDIQSLTLEQARVYLNSLCPRDAAIARLAIVEGMRPGEILALRFRSILDMDLALLIEERVYRGSLKRPKNGKSRQIGVSPGTWAVLQGWLESRTAKPPDAFLFPSATGKTPLTRDNLWRRSMHPALKKVGLEWASFQELRKTNATLMKKAKVDVKVGADQRGHGVGVSLAVYTESDIEQKQEAVRTLDAALSAEDTAEDKDA